MKRTYQFGFHFSGLLIFMITMLPTFLWLVFPAPNDILRVQSVTPVVDSLASVFQVGMVILLVCLKNGSAPKMHLSKWLLFCVGSIGLYYLCWAFYYAGSTGALVMLGLTIPPCLGFLFYELDRKNYIAIIPTLGFAVCHLIYCIWNFIL